jgi:hypothetical protein
MAHLKLLIEQYRSKKTYPELVYILQMRSDISTKIARSAAERASSILKLQMIFLFFYKNREICNKTRSVATQTSDDFSCFLQKSQDLQQKHVCIYSLSLEIEH